MGSPSRGGDVAVYVWLNNNNKYYYYVWLNKSTELAHSFLFHSCVYFCLYGPFNCISLHEFSWQISVFSPCSSGLISALLVLCTICLFMKFSFSLNIISSGWLGSKHQLTTLHNDLSSASPEEHIISQVNLYMTVEVLQPLSHILQPLDFFLTINQQNAHHSKNRPIKEKSIMVSEPLLPTSSL